MSNQILNGIAINNYPVFEGSQVLTSDQLNGMFSYLDQRDRYTRSRLIGIGIVCGLHVSVSQSTGNQRLVHISEGLGISSEGYLIRMPDCTMTYARKYSLPPDTVYEPFGNYTDNIFSQDRSNIQLYELLTNEPVDDPVDYEFIDAGFL
ncbi:MAG: hypothetical protein AAF551_13945, partial [Bacteroidota bacterium]